MDARILPKSFYMRPALVVARELIGKFLVMERDGKQIARMITETEAYVGPEDLACHASKGKTMRTQVMFEEGGVWYVYFIYGMYEMLNVVTGEKEHPSAVLFRGVDGVSGPGRLTRFFGIDRSFNAKRASTESGLYVEDRGIKIKKSDIKKTARIGVDYSGPIWSKKEYRFVLETRNSGTSHLLHLDGTKPVKRAT